MLFSLTKTIYIYKYICKHIYTHIYIYTYIYILKIVFYASITYCPSKVRLSVYESQRLQCCCGYGPMGGLLIKFYNQVVMGHLCVSERPSIGDSTWWQAFCRHTHKKGNSGLGQAFWKEHRCLSSVRYSCTAVFLTTVETPKPLQGWRVNTASDICPDSDILRLGCTKEEISTTKVNLSLLG